MPNVVRCVSALGEWPEVPLRRCGAHHSQLRLFSHCTRVALLAAMGDAASLRQCTARLSLKMGRISDATMRPTTLPMTNNITGSANRESMAMRLLSSRS